MPATDSLSPEALKQIKRLDLRARMVVKGFLQGLHASPLQGFSVQFSEHRRYTQGDDPKLIDWLAYAKTDKYFVKRFEAETNMVGYLAIDLSGSMAMGGKSNGVADGNQGSTSGIDSGVEAMSKFEYSMCLAASLTYLMTMQQDPVGLVTFDDKLKAILPARSRKDHLGNVIASLSKLTPSGTADLNRGMQQLASMLRHQSLIMVFSDLLPAGRETEQQKHVGDDDNAVDVDETLRALARLKHGGHDVIVFHVLDRQEVEFDFEGPVQFEDAETGETITVDADGFKEDYQEQLDAYRDGLSRELSKLDIDYVPIHTGMPFDKALSEYLIGRRSRM